MGGVQSTKPLFSRQYILTGGVSDYIASGSLFLFFVFLILYKKSNFQDSAYNPKRAWLLANLFFTTCLIISWATGVIDAVLVHPSVYVAPGFDHQLWLGLTCACFGVILVGYWGIWPIGTVTYGRPLVFHTCVLFGLVNGLCETSLYLSMWAGIEVTGWPRWATALAFFFVQGGLTANWHTHVWDKHVAPEHNVLSCNIVKVFTVHVPNVLITYTHLMLFGQPLMYVLFETTALVGSTTVMHFPPWWSTYTNPPQTDLIRNLEDVPRAELWQDNQWNPPSSQSRTLLNEQAGEKSEASASPQL